MSKTLAERLMAKVSRDESGCWLWTGATMKSGYGVINRGRSEGTALVHRVSYELRVGEIPAGLQLDHLCRVRNCVNPAHLEPVSQKTNLLRGESDSAKNARKSHCPRGHELAEPNLMPSQARRGQRSCLACSRAQSRIKFQGGAEHFESIANSYYSEIVRNAA